MKYIFRLDSNLLTVELIIPASWSKCFILKNLRLGDTPSQTHAVTLNPTHSKILVASQTNGKSWCAVKPVDAQMWHTIDYIFPLPWTHLRMWQFLFKVSVSGLQHRAENLLISSFKSPISVYPITFPVLFLYTKLPYIFISSKTTLTFFSCSFRLSKFISFSICSRIYDL